MSVILHELHMCTVLYYRSKEELNEPLKGSMKLCYMTIKIIIMLLHLKFERCYSQKVINYHGILCKASCKVECDKYHAR